LGIYPIFRQTQMSLNVIDLTAVPSGDSWIYQLRTKPTQPFTPFPADILLI
jgi:hypothetical protein